MSRYDYDGPLDAAKGIVAGVAISAVGLVACGVVAKLMWRVFMFGWGLA